MGPDSVQILQTDLLARASRFGIGIWRNGTQIGIHLPECTNCRAIGCELASVRPQLLTFPALPRADLDCIAPLSINRSVRAIILCIHPAHGSVYDYRHFAAAADEDCAVFGIHATRLLLRAAAPRSRSQLIGRYVRQIIASKLAEKPLILFGTSSGGLLAIAVAGALAARGIPPSLVALGDTLDSLKLSAAAQRIIEDRFVWKGFIETYLSPQTQEMVLENRKLWRLSDAARVQYILDCGKQLPDGAHVLPMTYSVLWRQVRIQRAYFSIYGDHEQESYAGRTVYIKASRSDASLSREVRARLVGEVRVNEVEGDHLSILRPPVVGHVVRTIIDSASLDSLK